MTLPKISTDCLLATISKMSQVPRQEFAADVMTDLAINSPELMGALTALLSGLLEPQDVEQVDLAVAQEILLETVFVCVGITLKSLNAQAEANELNEAWG